MEERHITVPRTARFHTLGDAATARALWIVLHGYGHLARYFLRKFEPLADGLFIVAPEGLSRFYLDEGHTRVGATWMTREDREHEIADQLTYLDQLARQCLGSVAPGIPLGVLGFSQGVATAVRWAVSGAIQPARIILWGGSLPPEIGPGLLAARLADRSIHLVHGEADAIVPSSSADQAADRFNEAGVQHTMHRHPGGHDLDRPMLERLLGV